VNGKTKGREGEEGEIDSDMQLEQGHRLAKTSPVNYYAQLLPRKLLHYTVPKADMMYGPHLMHNLLAS